MFDRIFDMRKPCISNHKLSRAHKLRLISLVQYEGTTPSLPLTVVTRMHTCTRSESRAIPSPHHLSWLALDTYKALFHNEEVRYTYIALFPGSSMFVAWPAVLQAVEGTRLRCTYVVTLLPVLHWMWIKEQQKKTGEAWERVCIHGRVQLRVFYHITSYAGPSPWLRGEVGWVSFAVVHNSWTHLILRSRCCKCVQFGEREGEKGQHCVNKTITSIQPSIVLVLLYL